MHSIKYDKSAYCRILYLVAHTFVESHTFAMGITGKGYGRKDN